MKRRLSYTVCHSAFVVFLLFVVVTLAFTYPLITQLGTHFAGANIDIWLNMWANWWTSKALREGLSFYQTSEIFYPHGVALYFHSFSHTSTAPWLLLEPLIGPLAAYNVVVLLGFVLLGFSVYLLVRELTGHVGAGLVSGLAATFAPYQVWECVHPTIFSTQYIPLALWALVVMFRCPSARSKAKRRSSKRWQYGLATGLFLTLCALSGWHQAMYAIVILGPYVAWNLVAKGQRWGRQEWVALLVAVLVAAVLVGPVIFPLLREQLRAGYAEPDIDWVFNTDVLAWVTPSFLHPLWGDAVRPFYERFPAPNRPAFVGYTVLALASLGLRHVWRERREHGWLVISTLLTLVMALGTRLYVNGEVILSNLPWYRPIIGFIRAPVRFNLMLGQCLAILAGLGVVELLPRHGAAVKRRVLGVILFSALILLEFLAWPFPTTRAYVSPFYAQLAHDARDFAIVEAPLDRQTDKFYMYWQTIHEKALVNGHVSRPPDSAFDFIEGNAITRAFARRKRLRDSVDLGAALSELADVGVRYLVIHKQFLPPDLASDWIASLATRPVYQDDDLTVFSTRPQAGVHFDVAHDFGHGSGPKLSQAWLEPGERPVLESHWSATERRKVTLKLSTSDDVIGATLPPSSLIYTEVLTVANYPFSRIRTPLPLSEMTPGEYTVSLIDSVEQSKDPLPTSSSFVVCHLSLDVDGGFCSRSQPDAVWNEVILLHGVDWHRLANTLYVALQWQARRIPDGDYKLFLHLLPAGSRSSTAPVAQFDGMPRDGAYPTSQWQAGELVWDEVQVDLQSVSEGEVQIALGWYDPVTQERLPGVDASGRPLPDRQLLLDQAVSIP